MTIPIIYWLTSIQWSDMQTNICIFNYSFWNKASWLLSNTLTNASRLADMNAGPLTEKKDGSEVGLCLTEERNPLDPFQFTYSTL